MTTSNVSNTTNTTVSSNVESVIQGINFYTINFAISAWTSERNIAPEEMEKFAQNGVPTPVLAAIRDGKLGKGKILTYDKEALKVFDAFRGRIRDKLRDLHSFPYLGGSYIFCDEAKYREALDFIKSQEPEYWEKFQYFKDHYDEVLEKYIRANPQHEVIIRQKIIPKELVMTKFSYRFISFENILPAQGKERFYEKISFGYNTALQNKINFKASEFGQEGFTDKFQNGMSHNFSIGLPSFTLLRYLNFSPSLSYGQNWFFRTTDYYYNPETDKVESKLSSQFSHFGITQNYSGGISMSTRIYGMFNFGKYHRVQAIRHVVSPSLSLSLSPEKGTAANGYRTLYYTDTAGVAKQYAYNIYSGQLNSPPGKGKSATMSWSIGNNLEAKVRDFADTTGKGSKKIKLIDQFSIRSGYNFLADSLKMSSISMSMTTSLFGKVSLSASANFDPYAIDEKGKKYNRYAFQAGQGLARFTNASASMSYSLSGKGSMNGNDGTKGADGGGGGSGSPADYYQRIYYHPVTGEYIPGGWLYYTNPNVPWSLNFSYSFSCSHSEVYNPTTMVLEPKNNITQTVSLSGNIKLTPRMSINANSGFDLQAKKITTTQISATYDLHCFNISVSWVPLGQWQSYNFLIRANAAALADLLRFRKSSSYWDN